VSELENTGRPPDLSPEEEPPRDAAGRETEWVADHDPSTRDTTPAVGKRGEPGVWRRAAAGARPALARPHFGDAVWSFLYKSHDTSYAASEAPPSAQIEEVNARMRSAAVDEVQGPFIKPPVWTWEVPVYFWVGGIASGASFVAMACDVAGDRHSAAIARRVSLGAVLPAPMLLIADLGRPERFLNMLRIFKPRSPMNMGAWCLVSFSTAIAGAVACDLVGLRRSASALGALTSVLGGYLGSYTGVLLASTAVPLWGRSRLFLGPIFVATATATGAAATRLTLEACGLPPHHPTRTALGRIETVAIVTELGLSGINERRLGRLAEPMSQGRAGLFFRAAKAAVAGGLALRLLGRRDVPHAHDAASAAYLLGGLAFRVAWVEAGKTAAADHEAVAASFRGEGPARATSLRRTPVSSRPGRLWTEAVRRTSLAVERLVRRQ
jgi:hypothetical protein